MNVVRIKEDRAVARSFAQWAGLILHFLKNTDIATC